MPRTTPCGSFGVRVRARRAGRGSVLERPGRREGEGTWSEPTDAGTEEMRREQRFAVFRPGERPGLARTRHAGDERKVARRMSSTSSVIRGAGDEHALVVRADDDTDRLGTDERVGDDLRGRRVDHVQAARPLPGHVEARRGRVQASARGGRRLVAIVRVAGAGGRSVRAALVRGCAAPERRRRSRVRVRMRRRTAATRPGSTTMRRGVRLRREETAGVPLGAAGERGGSRRGTAARARFMARRLPLALRSACGLCHRRQREGDRAGERRGQSDRRDLGHAIVLAIGGDRARLVGVGRERASEPVSPVSVRSAICRPPGPAAAVGRPCRDARTRRASRCSDPGRDRPSRSARACSRRPTRSSSTRAQRFAAGQRARRARRCRAARLQQRRSAAA